MSELVLSGVSHRFGGDTLAVDDVSLTVPSGCRAALIGASGSGKTTLLRMINGLLRPSAGRIRVDDQDIADLPGAELRRRIGYVLQGGGLFPHMTVGENIGITPKLLGWPMQRIAERVDMLLELVQLPAEEYADRLPAALSGGQQQRIAFARAMAAEPGLILLDEAFGALDPVIRAELQAEFSDIQEKLGFTALLVTHDMAEALLVADHIFVMDGGKLIRQGTPSELWREPGDARVEAMIHQPRTHAEQLAGLAAA